MSEPTGPRHVGADDSSAAARGETKHSHKEHHGGDHARRAGAPDGHAGAREHEWAMGETDWAAAPEYDEPDDERTIPAFLVGAVAGMVALGLVWAMTVFLDGAETDSRRGATSAETSVAASPGSTGTTAPKPGQEAVAATPSSPQNPCEAADAALAAPLRAAAPAMDQWEIHVGAMNKLMVGAITAEQAGAFWSESKVGATRNLKRFDAANEGSDTAGTDCPAPDKVSQAAPPGLRSCARHVARERTALEAAGTALQTWKGHIRDMKMLDMGHLAPDEASRLWLANWERGIKEIRDYRAAQRAAAGTAGC